MTFYHKVYGGAITGLLLFNRGRLYITTFWVFVCFWPDSPPVGQGLLIHEVSRSHTTTHHMR